MAGAFLNLKSRDFSPLPASGLTREARDDVNAALKAMSDWRNEIAEINEKNGSRVIDRVAAAASALGWPEQVVESARTQLQSVGEMQAKAIDQVMDAWEEQVKLPNQAASPSAMFCRLKSGGFPPAAAWPTGADMAAGNPLQLWMQFADQWQKAWADAVTKATEPWKPGST